MIGDPQRVTYPGPIQLQMKTGTIFFSYSRQDSNFVIHLAQSLREAGATVWLDQLDIKPGSRWDKSIEQALYKSDTLLVILSKASVNSSNVMDEVSFALEEQKRVVPILLEECDIPFRLRRLQFADFTGDRQQALKTLIQSLGLDPQIAHRLSNTAADHNLVDKAEETENTASASQITYRDTLSDPTTNTVLKKTETSVIAETPKPRTKGRSKKIIYFSAGLIVVALSIWSFFHFSALPSELPLEENQDVINWNAIAHTNDPELLKAHLFQFNPCEHLALAQHKIDSLTPEITEVIPEEPEPEPEPTPEELARAEEQKKWDAVLLFNDYNTFITFYKTHLDSEFAKEARTKIASYLDQTGYVYYGSKYSNYFDLAFEENDDGIPQKDAFYKATATRTIRGSNDQGKAAFNQVKGSVKPGSLVIIEEVIESGSSYWIKIQFSEERFIN